MRYSAEQTVAVISSVLCTTTTIR